MIQLTFVIIVWKSLRETGWHPELGAHSAWFDPALKWLHYANELLQFSQISSFPPVTNRANPHPSHPQPQAACKELNAVSVSPCFSLSSSSPEWPLHSSENAVQMNNHFLLKQRHNSDTFLTPKQDSWKTLFPSAAIIIEGEEWKCCPGCLIGNQTHLNQSSSPSWVAQLVRASSWYTEVVGSIPGQGTYKSQPMNASISGTVKIDVSLSQINKKKSTSLADKHWLFSSIKNCLASLASFHCTSGGTRFWRRIKETKRVYPRPAPMQTVRGCPHAVIRKMSVHVMFQWPCW